LQSRTGTALKWAVSALLIAALGLGSWQLADALMERSKSDDTQPTQPTDGNKKNTDKTKPGKLLKIQSASEFAPSGTGIQEDEVPLTVDGKSTTSWVTPQYKGYANFGNLPNRKYGSGIIVDLGSLKTVTGFDITMYRSGQSVEVLAASGDTSSASSLSDFSQHLTPLTKTGKDLKGTLKNPLRTRYVLIHITELPTDGSAELFRGGISEITLTGS
jgi:hypothetical protein